MRLNHSNWFRWLLAPIFAVAVHANAAELPASRHAFVVIAHRGNHEHAHENTLAALRAAIIAGADYGEIDVRRTADGGYVLMHDRTVDRMTDGRGAVKDLTLAQLKALNVRDLKRPLIPPDRIPTFSEALHLVKGSLNVYLDFKEGNRAEVGQMIRDAGVTKQVLVYDGIEAVPEWHRVAPELPLIISPPDSLKTPGQVVAFAITNRIEVLDGSWDDYDKAMVDAASNAKVKVWPDIQSGQENGAYFEKVLARGFTGVQTDHPEELIDWLAQHNRR